MCGIAGSSDANTAFALYQSNLARGYYSSGEMIVGKDGKSYSIGKEHGVFKYPRNLMENYNFPYSYTLYHSRGPTTETGEFVPDNNHPFVYKDWIVAHNGIISNFEELCKKYFPEEDFTGKTDSCIIPRMLSIKPMKDALEELKGTFGLWIWTPYSNGAYICRSGVTLFANYENGDFCSTEFEGSEPLQEGYIYKIEGYKKIIRGIPIKTKSPYFVL